MPTYAYACTECDHRFEAVQSFSDDSLTVCPECEGRLRKVFNAVGVVFKGSGFYRNDSRSSSGTSRGSGDGSDSRSREPVGAGSGGSDSGSPDKGSASGSSGSSDKGSTGSGSGRDKKPAAPATSRSAAASA